MGEYSCFGEGQYRKKPRIVVLVPSPFSPLSSFLREIHFFLGGIKTFFFFKVFF